MVSIQQRPAIILIIINCVINTTSILQVFMKHFHIYYFISIHSSPLI